MARSQLSSRKNSTLASLAAKAALKSRLLVQGRLGCFKLALSLVEGKSGIEIGGPTDVFQPWHAIPRYYYGLSTPLPIYDRVGSLDNCNFSDQTIWSSHQERFHFSRSRPPGRNIIAEGSNLSPVSDAAYDFVLNQRRPARILWDYKVPVVSYLNGESFVGPLSAKDGAVNMLLSVTYTHAKQAALAS